MKLNVENLCFSYEGRELIKEISLHVENKEFVGIIGPNGSGKSTLLKNIVRSWGSTSGLIEIDQQNILKLPYKKTAALLATIGQENEVPFDFTVYDIVAMGRFPYKKIFETDTNEDQAIILDSLEKVGLLAYRNHNYMHISGGEKQRVMIARGLAQQTSLLVLDEPTNHLDVYYQLQIFDLLKKLQVTVLSAIHDLNIAALYCDRLYVIKEGQVYASGSPEDILTPQLILEVFGVHCETSVHPTTQKVAITYLPESFYGKNRRP